MKTVWLQSAGQLFLIQRFDDGSYGVVLDDEFLGFVARADRAYIAIADDGAVVGEASTLGAAASILAGRLLDVEEAVALSAA